MKQILIALGVSLIIHLIGAYVNYESFKETKYLKWSYKMHGGECLIEFGFGFGVLHKYSMRQEGKDTANIYFEPITLFISFIVLSSILYGLIRIVCLLI